MKTHLSLCLLITLLVFPIHAQETASKANFNHGVRFTTSYDKSENRTTVKIDAPVSDPTMGIGNGIVLTAFFRFKGEDLREPVQSAALRFTTDKRDWRFVQNRDLTIFVDGVRISFLNGGRVGQVGEPPDTISIGRTLYFGISRDDLARIANGRVVEMKLSSKSYKLTAGQLEVLRDLVERMNPPRTTARSGF